MGRRICGVDTRRADNVLTGDQEIDNNIYSVCGRDDSRVAIFAIIPSDMVARKAVEMLAILVKVCLFITIMTIILDVCFSGQFADPVQRVDRRVARFSKGSFDHLVRLGAGARLSRVKRSCGGVLGGVRGLLTRVGRRRKILEQARLGVLLTRVGPRFLCGALSAVCVLTQVGKRRAAVGVVRTLSGCLHLSLDGNDSVIAIRSRLRGMGDCVRVRRVQGTGLFHCRVRYGIRRGDA